MPDALSHALRARSSRSGAGARAAERDLSAALMKQRRCSVATWSGATSAFPEHHVDASAGAGAAAITSAVLVNYHAPRVCTGHRFTVGVFHQPGSGGSHAYHISVYNPAHQRILYHHGYATSRWKFWRIRTTKAGTYHIIYHADGIRVRYPTRAHSCG
jgi:hypothetical protein